MGGRLVHYVTGLRPLMVWDCYLPIVWVACENSRFSLLLAVWDVSPGETSAPERKKSIVIIPTCLLCQMQAKSSGTEFLRSIPSSDWLLFCLYNLLLFLCSLCRRPRGIFRELKQQQRWRLQKRHLKSEFALPQTLSRLFHLVQFIKCWQFSLELDSERLYRSSGKEKECRCLVFTSSIKREMQWRLRNNTKKRDARAELLFC